MKKLVIREFKSRRAVESATSYEAGFARCIELYRASGRRQSFFVEPVKS